MSVVLILMACIVFVYVVLFWRVPEGYEDETGFHEGPMP